MKEVIFYEEWLSLSKNEFRIMAMLAEQGEYTGNLTDLCRYFSLTPQTRNTTSLRTSINSLNEKGFLTSQQRGRTYQLNIVPKAKEITAPQSWVRSLMIHEKFSEDVSWEQILKVYLWIANNQMPIVTNEIISAELNISVSTIGLAKKVLQQDYEAITRKRISEKIGEDTYRNIGQMLAASAIIKQE